MESRTPTCTTLVITGMTCWACVRGVTAALSRVPGVTRVNVEIGRAVVEGDAGTAALIAAVEQAGYGARLAADETERSTSNGRRCCC